MPGHDTHQPHGSGVRGMYSLSNIDGHEGRFGRLFPDLVPARFTSDDLFALAEKIVAGPDPIKDGPDEEEGHIPSAYTYFGQFVDHDLTFDPSTFEQQKSDPNGIVDFRSPRFDLDCIYGRGPGDQPYLYFDPFRFMVGDPLTGAARNPLAKDLARTAHPNSQNDQRAIIGDPRNDENVIVSEFQGMMYRFHHRMVDRMPGKRFDEIQREVRWHYQWVVLHDFLPRFVDRAVLDGISEAIVDTSKTFASYPPLLRFYDCSEPVIPVEFSVAAYRMGHSMVRPGYRLNETAPVLPIFDPVNPKLGLNAFGKFNSAWAIDWQRFIDLGIPQVPNDDFDRVQMAYKIDTSMVDPLRMLPLSVAGDEAEPTGNPRLKSLAFRNLERSVLLRLPNGQAVARRMGVTPLNDAEILIGKALDDPEPGDEPVPISQISPAFVENCPLWVYILAEARHQWERTGEARLGEVGGRIVAEVFLGLMLLDKESFLVKDPYWKPAAGHFTLADLLNEALLAS